MAVRESIEVPPTGEGPEVPGAIPPPEGPGSPALRELRTFFDGLLREQCEALGALAGAAYLAAGEARGAGLVSVHQSNGPVMSPAVLARVERLATEMVRGGEGSRAEAITLPRAGAMYGEEARHKLLAAPLVADGRTEGACVLLAPARSGPEDAAALRVMELAAARFEAFLWRRQALAEAEQKLILRQTLELLDLSQQGRDASSMGAIMCQELRRRFACTRVSIGLVKRGAMRLAAVSGAEEIDTSAPGVEPLESAMEECAAQDVEVVYPPPPEAERDPAQRRVTRAHDELSRRYGPSAILSLPLRVEGDLVGVVVMERAAEDPFSLNAAALLRLVAETIGPALWTRRLADRGVLAVARDRLLELGDAIVGPRHTGAKLVGLALLAALVLAAVVPVPARVTADAEIRAVASRAIVPPFEGYLESVEVKPGDAVKAGDVLARMDTTEFRQRLSESEARLASLVTQRDESLAKGELNKVRVLGAQIDEVQAAVTLFRDHLERAAIRAPMDALVGRGDLEPFLRAHVTPQQTLMELVTPEQRAVVYVGERDVQRVKAGQTGRILVRGRAEGAIPVRVVRVNPAASVVRGKNVFEAEVELVKPTAGLGPGMSGVAKLNDGFTTTLAALLRPMADELRLRMWW